METISPPHINSFGQSQLASLSTSHHECHSSADTTDCRFCIVTDCCRHSVAYPQAQRRAQPTNSKIDLWISTYSADRFFDFSAFILLAFSFDKSCRRRRWPLESIMELYNCAPQIADGWGVEKRDGGTEPSRRRWRNWCEWSLCGDWMIDREIQVWMDGFYCHFVEIVGKAISFPN